MANGKLLGVPRKYAIPGIVVIAGVVGFEIYRKEKAKSAAAASAAAAAGVANAQAANAYGYGATPYGYGTNNGYYGYGITYGYGASGGFYPQGYYGYGTPYPPGSSQPPTPITTNAQWAQAAINQLQQDGYNPASLAAALGAYELGQPVTAGQETMVNAAIGVEGYPPQSGPNGYPPAIKTQGTPGGGGGGGQGGSVTVPNVTGDRASVARKKLRDAGLKYNINDKATGTVKAQNPRAGAKSDKGDIVQLTLGK